MSSIPVIDLRAREQRWARRSGARRLGALVVVAVLAVTGVALVTNDPLGSSGAGLVTVDQPLAAPSPATGAPPAVTDLAPTVAGIGPISGAPTIAVDSIVPGVVGASPGAVAGSADGPAASGSTTAEGTMIVSPVLQFFAFGGQIGMPLVCSVAAGAAGPALTDPGVSAVVGQILSACVTQANEGADALRAMDAELSALAAINPAVGPVLDQLAAVLQAAGSTDAPFVSYLFQIVALVRFFQGQ